MTLFTDSDATRVGNDYVAIGLARLQDFTEVGRAELRVCANLLDPDVVGQNEAYELKGALAVVVEALAKARARADGH